MLACVGYILVFMLGLWSVVQGLFAMTHLMADQVLGYLGAGHTSDLGKSTEERTRSVFIPSVRGAAQRIGMGGLGGRDRGDRGGRGAGKEPGKASEK